MKNNVICLFVDSVSYSSISTHRAKVSPTPFVDSLKEESITATSLYSHGPYTDAAIRSLFTGRNCLDDFGYYYRLNTSPINDFKLFHDAGYETYGFYYPFIMYGDNIKKYIDHSYYTSGFIFGSEWGGTFKYYFEKAKVSPLNKVELALLKNRFSLFFNVFESYLRDIQTNGECRMLYDPCLKNYDVNNALSTLLNEKRLFQTNPIDYINDFLKIGDSHLLWKIDTTSIDTMIDSFFLDEVVKENNSFFAKAKRNNILANFISLFPGIDDLRKDFKALMKSKSFKEMIYLRKYKSALFQIRRMQKRWHHPEWQVACTSHTILSSGIKVIKEKGLGKDKPFYMSLVTEDPHSNLAMFAYDINDRQEVNDEIKVLNDYVSKLGTNFKGSLLYLLSLRYVDYEIEKFCTELKKIGLWENTTLMIVSDHGSSFTDYPLRPHIVNCFDDECYHVPITIRHPNYKGMVIKSYQNSKDVLPTVCDLIGIPQSPFFKGHSMIDETVQSAPYVLTEYMGPGCPDMSARRMWLSSRDKNYLVAYKVGIYENFEDGELAEVYDLKKDPLGKNNIADTVIISNIQYLLNPLKRRHEEIKRNALQFIEDILKGGKL